MFGSAEQLANYIATVVQIVKVTFNYKPWGLDGDFIDGAPTLCSSLKNTYKNKTNQKLCKKQQLLYLGVSFCSVY